ncbi:MAG TPA: hypothetical protein VJ183_06480 [Chloroflexia bacterium]|nr:hypothetical protein [Chloroflexia bacterium]
MSTKHNQRQRWSILSALLAIIFALLALSGCLEQIQSPHSSTGALHNYLLHLQAGELDDARAYFAPGLVTPSPALDQSIKAAADRVRRYQVEEKSAKTEDEQKKLTVPLENGEVQETLRGRVRPLPAKGEPTPGPDEGWQEMEIITARMVARGPGWRILDFELKCCP